MVGWLLVLGFSGYLLLRHKKGRVLGFIAIPVTAAGAFLTASRGSFMWGMINATATSLAFIWGAPWRQGEVLRVFRSIQRVAIGIGLGIVLLFYAYPDALLSRLAIYQETLTPNSPKSELAHRGWYYPVENFLGAFNYERWPYGYGIGTASLGGQYVTRIFNAKPPVGGVESGYGTLVVEMGIMGLILWLVLSVAILFSAWKVLKKLKGFALVPAWICDFLVRILLAFSGHIWRHAGLPRLPFECVLLAVARFAFPASLPRALGAVRGQRSHHAPFAPLDTLTCGSPLFHRLSTGAMARNARLRNCLNASPGITVARYIFTRSALKISRSASPNRHNQRRRRTRDASSGTRFRLFRGRMSYNFSPGCS